jgi:outer membrane protein OmpA-like peptidoglycan-associated protein
MRRFLVLAVVLGGAPGAAAQQSVSGAVSTLQFPTAALVFRVEDLVFNVQTLVFKVEDVGGQVQQLQVRETATEMRIELPADILFDFDKADIRAAAEPALKQVADIIRQRRSGTAVIEGHTDGKGSASYNQKLSQRRAASVQKWLVEREGVKQVRFSAKGFGATRPVAPNTKRDGSDDPEGRQKNRRVEIVLGRR